MQFKNNVNEGGKEEEESDFHYDMIFCHHPSKPLAFLIPVVIDFLGKRFGPTFWNVHTKIPF